MESASPTVVIPETARARPLKQVESDTDHAHPVRISALQNCSFSKCPHVDKNNFSLRPCPFCFGATLYCSKNCQMSDLLNHKLTCAATSSRISDVNIITQQRLKQLGLRKQAGVFELCVGILENSELVDAVKQDVFFLPLSFNVHEMVRAHSHIKHVGRSELSPVKDTSSCTRQAIDWVEKHYREHRSSDEEKANYLDQVESFNKSFIEIATNAINEKEAIRQVKAEQKGKEFIPLTDKERILQIVEAAKKERAKPINRRSPFAPDDYLYLIAYPPDLTFAFALAFPANAHNVSLGHKMENGLFTCHCRLHKPMI